MADCGEVANSMFLHAVETHFLCCWAKNQIGATRVISFEENQQRTKPRHWQKLILLHSPKPTKQGKDDDISFGVECRDS
jgi:hypothetical protein